MFLPARFSCKEQLFCVWCSAHRIDLVVKKYEDLHQVGDILRMLRRLSTHVRASISAQARLSALHRAMSEDEAACPLQLSFAPQRFLSHASPARALLDSFASIISYITDLSQGDEAQHQTAWARAIRTDVMELRTWLILGAAADFLACMRKLNVQTQKGELRILAVESLLDAARDYLNKYMTRQTGALACALRSLFVRPNHALHAQSATCPK